MKSHETPKTEDNANVQTNGASDGTNGAADTPATETKPALETVAQIAARFAGRTGDESSLRSIFAYADHSVVFGNGQFPHVPAYFGNATIDPRKAVIALALDTARGGANNMSDDNLGAIVAQAEKSLADFVMPSLLEEAVDNYFYKMQRMTKDERKAAGITAVLKSAAGTPLTNFASRQRLVQTVLGFTPVDAKGNPRGPAAGMPSHGKSWLDIIDAEIRAYVSTCNTENKKKAKGETVAATTAPADAARNSAESLLG